MAEHLVAAHQAPRHVGSTVRLRFRGLDNQQTSEFMRLVESDDGHFIVILKRIRTGSAHFTLAVSRLGPIRTQFSALIQLENASLKWRGEVPDVAEAATAAPRLPLTE